MIDLSETAGPRRSASVFHEFPQQDRQPLWRRGLFVLSVAGAHLLALFLAFGVVMRPMPPTVLPALSVRVLAPAPPRSEPPKRHEPLKKIEPQGRVERARPAALAPRRPAPLPTTEAPAPLSTAVAPQTSAAEALSALPALPPTPLVAARFDANYLHNPRPVYPPASRRMGEEGRVLLRVTVSPQGVVVAVAVRQSSGFSRLDEAARAAVERWRFVPARRGDEAIEASVLVPLQFTLDD